MQSWIKICGVTRSEDAEFAVQLGIDAIGFVMHTKSPRCCDASAAREMIRKLPSHVTSVGVWFDEPAEVIATMAKRIGCKLIQTYDPNAASELRKLGFRVLQALGMPVDLKQLNECSRDDSIIFDTGRRLVKLPKNPIENERHEYAQSAWTALRQFDAMSGARLILAGGLNCNNVRDALEAFRPDGVDVASGIESAPGVKDREEMTRFVEVVREWSEKASSARTAVDSYPKQ